MTSYTRCLIVWYFFMMYMLVKYWGGCLKYHKCHQLKKKCCWQLNSCEIGKLQWVCLTPRNLCPKDPRYFFFVLELWFIIALLQRRGGYIVIFKKNSEGLNNCIPIPFILDKSWEVELVNLNVLNLRRQSGIHWLVL